jgi:hypothetical protein
MSGRSVLGFVRVASLVLATILVIQSHPSAAAEFPPQPTIEDARRRIDSCSTSHPRLLATQRDLDAVRTAVTRDPLKQEIAGDIIRRADALQEIPPIERIVVGRRLLYTSRQCLKRVLTLAMAYHLTGNARHVARCQEEMLAAARFEDWHPTHFLDVAEMTFALAIGYDWLFNELDEPARREIRRAIVDKEVRLQFVERDNW